MLNAGSHTEIVQSGKYKFKIIRNIEYYRDEIWTHTYKVGDSEASDYGDCLHCLHCLNISYFYQNNKPVRALIPHLLYEPECAIGTTLDAGGGTEIMVKTALRYAFKDVKTLPNFEFQDSSHIDCLPKDLSKALMARPVNLAYFYIAYHGMTWYEARFNAEMSDKVNYACYRKQLKFLTDPAAKPSFDEFKAIILSAFSSLEELIYVEKLYKKASTYREFFEAIPKTRRCDILYPWLNTFMDYYIGSVYSVKDWIINVNKMDQAHTSTGGSLSKGPKYRIYSYQKMNSIY
jgi:hypothetical protein